MTNYFSEHYLRRLQATGESCATEYRLSNLANGDTLVARATDERKPGAIANWKVVK